MAVSSIVNAIAISYNYKSLSPLLLERKVNTNKITYFTFNQDHCFFAAGFQMIETTDVISLILNIDFYRAVEIMFYCSAGQFSCRCVDIFYF